ncbi:MAG: hypothetical protein ACHQTE_00275 [Candidatus Saccharimonadales bacterium]
MEYDATLPYEFAERPNNLVYHDILTSPMWQEFCLLAQTIEDDLAKYGDLIDDDLCERIDDFVQHLNDVFGGEYQGQFAKVTGQALHMTVGGRPTGKQTSIDSEYVQFYSIDIQQLDSAWKVVCEFYISEYRAAVPNGIFLMLPSADASTIERLEICADNSSDGVARAIQNEQDDNLQNLIAGDVIAARHLTTSVDFLATEADEQAALLEAVAAQMYGNICGDGDEQITRITCGRYYAVPDDMKDLFTLQEFLVDNDGLEAVAQTDVSGTIKRFVYPEIDRQNGLPFRAASDFSIGKGAPCLELRNHELGYTYLIVPSTIRSIETSN